MLPSSPAPDHPYFALPAQHQRDRAWSVLGPALLDCHWSPADLPLISHAGAGLWEQLAALPAPSYRSSRLGLMFEQLWQQFLQNRWPRIGANLQLADGQRTLGELDILVDDGQQHWHLELALKFYLARQQDWIGPNSRDQLYRKIRHTREHQLQLSKRDDIRQQLAAQGWFPQQHLAVMRGCLFYPASGAAVVLPDEINPQHWRGLWCHQRDMASYLPEGEWSLLSKEQWLSPAKPALTVPRAELLHYLQVHFRFLSYPACAVLTAPGPYGDTEQQRWLIMPDHWPEQGTHSRLRARPL